MNNGNYSVIENDYQIKFYPQKSQP